MARSGGRFDFSFEDSRSRIVVALGQVPSSSLKGKGDEAEASIKSLARNIFFQIGEYLTADISSDQTEKEGRERRMEYMSRENKNNIVRKGF